MKLEFLQRTPTSRSFNTVGSLNNNGTIQLSAKCTDDFNLKEDFIYAKVAIDPEAKDSDGIYFFVVDIKDRKSIETDPDVFKMTVDSNNDSRRFTFSALKNRFNHIFEKLDAKSIKFNVSMEKIDDYNVLRFDLIQR